VTRARWAAAAALGLALLAALAFGAGTALLRSSLPRPGGEVALPGLHGRVVVAWDARGVPSIIAGDLHDLFFAQGYIHARDRLWQMDLARRVAQGRLAELFGPDLVETDRFLRTAGLWRAAARAESALAGDARAWLGAYAEGVNAWIETAPAWPPEFLVLRARPERWTARHSLAVGKLMAWDLTEWDLSLALARAVERVGAERAAELFPRVPDWSPRIVPAAGARRAAGELRHGPEGRGPRVARVSGTAGGDALGPGPWRAALAAARLLPEPPAPLRTLLDAFAFARASNAWVVGPARSRSGAPVLANDMHLPMRAPAAWYLAGLHAPGYDAVGMTIAGVPGIIAGHTRRVAWGYTAAMVDNVDFFVETLHPEDSTLYRTPDGWAPFTFREETIPVRGRRPVVLRVAETRHGPVLPPRPEAPPGLALAMAWTGAEPGGEAEAVLRLNRAQTADDVVAALRGFRNPGVNVVFADADGRIGYRLAAAVPVRRAGDGVLPAPGADGTHDWIGTVPYDSLPRALDPAEGYIVTANNLPQDGGPYVGAHFMPGYRAARIVQMVEAAPQHDAASTHEIQLDLYDLFAERHLDRAVRAARDAGLPDAARRLQGWDRRARAESPAAALFYTWVERLRWHAASDDYGDTLGYFPWEVLDRMMTEGASAWFDDTRTPEPETIEAVAARAMRDAVSLVGDRTWGEIHPLVNEHPLGRVRWLDRLVGFRVGPFPAAGGPFTVNAAHHRGTVGPNGGDPRPPFPITWAVSQRHVVDLADPDGQGGFVLPTGNSGHPLSPHYDDQVASWRSGGLHPIPVDPARARETAARELVLVPAPRATAARASTRDRRRTRAVRARAGRGRGRARAARAQGRKLR
jgi:penicillin amidase